MLNKRILFTIITLLLISTTISAQKLIHKKSFDVCSGELLTIKADCGDIKITAGTSNEVEIKVFGNSRAEDKIEFTFEKTSEGVEVIADKDGSWGFFSNIKLKFEVEVPEDFNLHLKTAGGDIFINDVNGEKEIHTSGGDIKLRDIEGNSDIHTSGGDIQIHSHNGNLKGSTSGGDIRANEIVGSVKVSTSGGDIEISSSEGKIGASTSGGDVKIHYNGKNEGINLSSTGGDIDIFLSNKISADINLRTSGGDIDFEVSGLRADEVKKNKVIGKLNGGGPEIKASTSGGDITIR